MNLAWIGWLHDLNAIDGLSDQTVGIVCIVVSGLCGAIVGVERERRSKPAGLRTLILICVGSTVYTMASLMIADSSPVRVGVPGPDRGRIAAQIVSGIGFLGAGAIIHARHSVVGLTTAASIWVVAAVGVVVGAGYAAAGIGLALLIALILTGARVLDRRLGGPCEFATLRIRYSRRCGKARHLILGILDAYLTEKASNEFFSVSGREATDMDNGEGLIDVRYCVKHPHHRAFLPEIAALNDVKALENVDVSSTRDQPVLDLETLPG